MSHHHRSKVFAACLITTAMLLACSAYAKPEDYDITLVDDSHGKVKVHLVNILSLLDVLGATIRADASVGHGHAGKPTGVARMKAVPTSIPGEYAFKIEPGADVFDLDLEADVPGEVLKVKKHIHIKDPTP